MNIVLIGPSGAGKGTQAEKVAIKFNLRHIASGDLFRDNLERKTELGLLAKTYMDQGELVPDELTEAMLRDRLRQTDINKGVILDGFPRTVYQAEQIEKALNDMGHDVDAVIYLKVSDEVIVKHRIPGRLTCKVCQRPYHETYNPPQEPFVCDRCGGDLYRRNDDRPARTQARLGVFHRQTARLVDYFQQLEKLIIIDGEGTINQVNERINEAINSLNNQEAPLATVAETKEIKALKVVSTALSPEQTKHFSLNLVLLGPPGAGKGTQADKLSTYFNLRHISTGDLFRENLSNQTELGKLAKKYMDRGELVPDDVTEAMVRERLSRPDIETGFILDGFPRTLPQAEALTNIMTDMNRRIAGVLYFKVPDEVLIDRLSGRWICRVCQTPFHKIFNPFKSCPYNQCHGEHLYQRDDDKPETVRVRLQTFHGETAPLISCYKRMGILFEMDGTRAIHQVTESTVAVVKSLLAVDATGSAASKNPDR